MKNFLKHWLPVLIWLGVIFLGSTDMLSAEHTSRFLVPFLRWIDPQISFTTLNAIQLGIRKLGHLTEYAVLAMLLWRALRSGTRWQIKMSILRLRSGQVLFLTVLLACGLFAASDEFHQSFVPSRTASPNDVMIDICGTLIGLSIYWMFAKRRNSAKINQESRNAGRWPAKP